MARRLGRDFIAERPNTCCSPAIPEAVLSGEFFIWHLGDTEPWPAMSDALIRRAR